MVRFLAVLALLLIGLKPAAALVTDLTNKRIEIRYSFNGADLILFGAIGSSGVNPMKEPFDVVVVVRGPESKAVVRRKDKVGIIWINNEDIIFPAAPGYYAVAATRPIKEIASRAAFESYGIGFDYLPLVAETDHGLVVPPAEFRNALFRLRATENLYRQELDTVTHVAEGLFRTDVHLPAKVPVGEFIVETFLFQHGSLKARNRIKLNVDKEGFERAAYTFANEYPFWYGLTAVLVALAAGWGVGMISRK
ncbi:TIGR02186 family protein [Kordiimonas pumila]|uniref:TIGR02186 family protein n=1 Tax=Kordiimonas pumila TaxID=2161677 RepID=A0ABV7CZR8_9PROT|nr:TIGR02186 family protein [Kordiimonas pumila]